ncbi:hypothetical protein BDZ91DRAFT_821800 [Kalaharituber pfeilii]|nr:hypothetical protein BDZ91DRAFT_821800 [Kalaharituber pfeilii]
MPHSVATTPVPKILDLINDPAPPVHSVLAASAGPLIIDLKNGDDDPLIIDLTNEDDERGPVVIDTHQNAGPSTPLHRRGREDRGITTAPWQNRAQRLLPVSGPSSPFSPLGRRHRHTRRRTRRLDVDLMSRHNDALDARRRQAIINLTEGEDPVERIDLTDAHDSAGPGSPPLHFQLHIDQIIDSYDFRQLD